MAKKRAKKRWDEETARTVLRRADESGLTDRAFAQREGIDPQRLWWWRKRLSAAEATEVPEFAEVRVVAKPVDKVEVHLRNGRMVVMPVDVDPRRVAVLLDVIEGTSC